MLDGQKNRTLKQTKQLTQNNKNREANKKRFSAMRCVFGSPAEKFSFVAFQMKRNEKRGRTDKRYAKVASLGVSVVRQMSLRFSVKRSRR